MIVKQHECSMPYSSNSWRARRYRQDNSDKHNQVWSCETCGRTWYLRWEPMYDPAFGESVGQWRWVRWARVITGDARNREGVDALKAGTFDQYLGLKMANKDTPEACLKELLPELWEKMAAARLNANRRGWSIEVDGLADWIKRITALVGPVQLDSLGMPFLLSLGRYEGIGYRETAKQGKIPTCEWYSPEEEARVHALCEKYLSPESYS